MPGEPRFANPQRAYDAIVNPRGESASLDAMRTCKSRYAANSFSTSLVARGSETRKISARRTPVWQRVRIDVFEGHTEHVTDEKCDGVKDVAQDEL